MLSFSSKEKRFFIFVTPPRRYRFAVRNPAHRGAAVGAASPVSRATFSRLRLVDFRAEVLPALERLRAAPDLPAPAVLHTDFFAAVSARPRPVAPAARPPDFRAPLRLGKPPSAEVSG